MEEILKVQRYIVVDDDPTNNLICEVILKRNFSHAQIMLFTKPEEALEFISKHYSNTGEHIKTVILLDINMPVINGWEFLEVFKIFPESLSNQFTIFMLSSSVDERDKDQASRNSLVSGFLCKPLSIEDLKSGILKG